MNSSYSVSVRPEGRVASIQGEAFHLVLECYFNEYRWYEYHQATATGRESPPFPNMNEAIGSEILFTPGVGWSVNGEAMKHWSQSRRA